MAKELNIEIDEIGGITMDVTGCTGQECIAKSAPYENAVQPDPVKRNRKAKPEMARTSVGPVTTKTNKLKH